MESMRFSKGPYLLVLLTSFTYWMGSDDSLHRIDQVQGVDETFFWQNLGNASGDSELERPFWEIVSLRNLLPQTYQELWGKFTQAINASTLHFRDVFPDVPPYRLIPLIKAQIEYYRMQRLKRETVIQEFSFDGAKNTTEERLQYFDNYLGFANIAYENADAIRQFLRLESWELVHHEPFFFTEKPSHFLAFNPDRKELIISVKGTSSLSDLLTDVLHTPEPFLGGIHAHSGMLNSARFIVNRTKPLLDNLFLPLGYKIISTGHSLGAGCAQLMAMIFKWELGLDNVQCIAFAPPPTLNREATSKTTDFIFSLVAGDDVIPRWNFGVLAANLKILGELDAEMQSTGVTPHEFFERLNFMEKIQEFRDTVEQVASANGEHVDMHVAGSITYIAKTNVSDEFFVGDVSPSFPGLRRIEVSSSFLSDHSLTSYAQALNHVMKKEVRTNCEEITQSV